VLSATSYTFQISTSQTFASLLVNVNVSVSAYSPIIDLPRDTLLYWRVRANSPAGPGAWSRTRYLYTANPPGVPTLLSPASGATISSTTPILDWSDSSPPATYYEVQLSTDPGFATVLRRGRGGAAYLSQYTVEASLSLHDTYYWRVRAMGGASVSGGAGTTQFSQWSAGRSFRIP